MEPRLEHRLENVPGVLEAVDVANLVAVVSRDGQLGDPQFFHHQLDDDLGVEMKIIRVFFERDLRQRRRRVEPVTGMKFGERRPQHSILERGQDLVADPFVSRHAARARRLFVNHARTENGIGFLGQKRRE